MRKKEKKEQPPKTPTAKKEKKKKLIQLDSTQMWSPVKDVLEGIVITKDDRYVLIMEFAPINFGLLSIDEQEAIASSFGNAIKTFPNKFQIKIISRKANVDTHIHNIRVCMEAEQNDYCRAMQMDTIKQIQNDAAHGVSRRFILAFEYSAPSSLRRPSWNDIRNSMYFTAHQIASMLSAPPCNNTLLSTIGNSDHVLDILYNCMSRAESEYHPFDARIERIVNEHISKGTYSPEKTIPINDFIAPIQLDPSSYTSVSVDERHYTFGYIYRDSYPNRCSAGWMSTLVNLGEGIDVDIFVEKQDPKTVSRMLTYSMQMDQSELMHKSNTAADVNELENKLSSEAYIRQGLTNDQAVLLFSVLISVADDDPREAKRIFKATQNYLITHGMDLRPLHANHDLAFRSSLPLCAPDKEVVRYAKRNILSGDFGAAYPFTSFEINDPGGIIMGYNAISKSPLFLDLFDRMRYNNGNMIIFGTSGSGKSFLLQHIALQLRERQTKVVIIAPWKGHEYRPACDAIGGSFISLAPGSSDTINIMEIRKNGVHIQDAADGNELSILATKVESLRTFFSILYPDMTKGEERILQECIYQTYRDFGITQRNKSLIDPMNPSQYKRMPTLGDLNANLNAQGKVTKNIRDALYPFIDGTCKNFNGQTNVNLDSDYVVIDVSKMPDNLMSVAIYIADDYAYDTIQADRSHRKAIIIDELSRMIGKSGSESAAKFVQVQARTVRGFNCILIMATQDTGDFFSLDDGSYGKTILANCILQVVMKQLPKEAKAISEIMDLSNEESRRIANYDLGNGLLVVNRNHIEMKVHASPLVEELLKTNADPPETQARGQRFR